MTVRVALVGCGRISVRHAELLTSQELPEAQLVAVCDVDVDKARLTGEKYGVPHYSSMDTMAQEVEVDLFSVLTPSGAHAEHVNHLAPYGRNILVEKPMALTLAEADQMIRTCDQHGVRLFVVKQNRFNLPVQKMREALEAGRFGRLVLGTVRVRWCRRQDYYDRDARRGTWAHDGGVLTNQASHHVDLLEWMMGDVESVFARSTTALVNIEAEDTAVVTLKFTNGALGIIEATTATRPKDLEGSISILGETGTVEIGGFAVNELKTWAFETELEGDQDVVSNYSVNPPNVYGFGHKAYYEHVIASIKNNTPQLVDGLEGRRSLELISAIYESIETGQEVFLRFQPKHCRLGRSSS